MDHSAISLSNTISKQTLDEMSMFSASILDAADQAGQEKGTRSISNEKIRKKDVLLGTYEVTSDAIEGGMGSVWRVHHRGWDVDLAMKRPQPRFFAEGSEKSKEEFVAECENWIDLGLHPNIVSCYYVREISGVPSIFSEWMDNGSLKDRIRDGSLYEGSEEEVRERILDIAIQTARGLVYSHDHGLVHQDVKPGNILLSKDWDAKVADFGLAKAQSRMYDGGRPLSTGGTLEYCPKEQAKGAPAEPWMDVYAWALTVLEMFLRKRPWARGAEGLKYLPGNLPGGLSELLRRCLEGRQRDFDGVEEVLIAASGGKYARPEPEAAPDTAGSRNNRALSFLDLGNAGAAEAIWNNSKLSEDPTALFNRTIYRYRKAQIGLEDCLAALKKLYSEHPEIKEMEAIIADMEKRTVYPDPELYSIGRDLSDMEKIYLHPDGKLAVLRDMFDLYLADLGENRLIRKYNNKYWEYDRQKQLQIDDSGKYILFSHYGSEGGESLQIYHVREEDMVKEDEKNGYPYAAVGLYKYATFAGDKLIAFEMRSNRDGVRLNAFDCTGDLESADLYGSYGDKPLYTLNVQNESRFHFSPRGKRIMVYYADEYDANDKYFRIYDTLTGTCLGQYPLPSADANYNEFDSFAIDDEDRFMLHFKSHRKIVWYDLAHDGRNSFVWDLTGKVPEYCDHFFVHTFPGGTKRLLVHDKGMADFISCPVPSEDMLPARYLLNRAYSLAEIKDLEKESIETMEQLRSLLHAEKYSEALRKWKEAQGVLLFGENPEYEDVLREVDRTFRKKSLLASVKLGEYEVDPEENPGERPVLTWLYKGTRELLLSTSSSVLGEGRLIVRREDGSELGAIVHKHLDLKKKGFELFKTSIPCVHKVSRATASPDGDVVAIQLMTGYEFDIDIFIPAILFMKITDNGVEQLAFLNSVKSLNTEKGYFKLLRNNFLFTDKKNNLYCIPMSDLSQIRRISSGFPADTAKETAAAQKRMSEGVLSQEFNCNCLSDDFRRGCSFENEHFIRYAFSYEYEESKDHSWNADADRILRLTKGMFQNRDEKDVEDFRDILHSLGCSVVTRREADQRLK